METNKLNVKGVRPNIYKKKYSQRSISRLSDNEVYQISYKSFLTSLNNIHIPTTLFETLSNENWREAMNVKTKVLEKNKT